MAARVAAAAELRQEAGGVAKRGGASAEARSGGAEAGMARGKVLSGTEMAVMTHRARLRRRRAAEEKQRGSGLGKMKGTQL
jgi:hypothetical protein